MTSSYDRDMPAKDDMTVSTQFMFTEGHIRLLIWMCEAQAQFIDEACDNILQSGDCPSDSLLHCREGIADLKCWALRLLDALEADDDEEQMDDDEDESFDPSSQKAKDNVEALRNALQVEWGHDRDARRPQRRTPLQGLRNWLLSILQ
jgi:hypothetical protein